MINQEKTAAILKCFYKVYGTLGFGFLEKVYENALFHELNKSGLNCRKQVPIKVYYDEIQVGEYYADLIVDEEIIIELKAAETLVAEHELQLINYLKATRIEVGLLLNFGKEPQIKRKIFTDDRKVKTNP
jgi:GxxExxY protein